ncbi:PREDICTED: tRNA modification GTPase GTPBP3, mitochondrial [Vollenhovia emeryi]|uniref:tRNA modification GTPase GTPBP3, mitochondrial n=1 Tax=Vollenhovia emeryi TaxID=411798 RepID=UPI0005F3F75A|nr:PREDICTED: tRNA modification GTPase GTPBP3, mitochondrial [Vollenhovia emeryi]
MRPFLSRALPTLLRECHLVRGSSSRDPRLVASRGTSRHCVAASYPASDRRGTTICALSSGHGKCGVAVMRMSGSRSLEVLQKMTSISKLEPRKAYLRKIRDPETGEVIDNGLCLWFPGPRSFTGEDSVEFHVHGGPAILTRLMQVLSRLRVHPALPGEFTRRAFYNNKLDLTEVEGLADLIEAETECQRKQALLQADGVLRKLYDGWRKVLSEAVASIEAYIDFGEEENIESDVIQNARRALRLLTRDLEGHLADGRRGEILRSGVRTVIVGEPNVGKSSLLNRLVQRNAAIVTPIAGTTRDVIELTANISGYPVLIADTAGITEDTGDIVEAEGVRRARSHAENADFVVVVVDALKCATSGITYEDYVREYSASLGIRELLARIGRERFVVVANKRDLLKENEARRLDGAEAALISCTTEDGFQNLLRTLADRFSNICGDPSAESPTISQARHRNHLTQCSRHLHNYFELCANEQHDVAIAAEEIHKAMRELGRITGHVSTNEILDIIFKNFCIGK